MTTFGLEHRSELPNHQEYLAGFAARTEHGPDYPCPIDSETNPQEYAAWMKGFQEAEGSETVIPDTETK